MQDSHPENSNHVFYRKRLQTRGSNVENQPPTQILGDPNCSRARKALIMKQGIYYRKAKSVSSSAGYPLFEE